MTAPGTSFRLSAVSQPAAIWRALRLPVDLSTSEGRARERMRRIVLSAGASASAKLITIATSLISVPLTLHYLGPELYGVWMVISSFTVMLSFADMGLGNGILNAVAQSHGRGDRTAIRGAISSGYVMLAGIAFALLLSFACAYPFVPWYLIFNAVTPEGRAGAGPALAVFVFCFALSIPCSIVQKVQIGLQQSFVNSLWQALGSLLGLIAVLAVIRVHGSLAMLVGALVGAPLLAMMINTVAFFYREGADLRPSFALLSRTVMMTVGNVGILFFIIQLIGSIKYGSDTLILAQILGASTVPQYAIPERLFAIISMLIAMATAPLWPAYGEAIARGDVQWVRHALKRSLLIAGLAAAGMSIGLVVVGPAVIQHWVGPAVQPSLLLLLGLGIWRVVEACGNAVAFYLNGANLMKVQVWIAGATAIVMITLKITLIQKIGPAGVPWAGAISFVLFSGIPYLFVVRRNFRHFEPAK